MHKRRRQRGVRDFIEALNNLPGRAMVFCATLANAARAFDLDESWDHRPAFATVPEWEIRRKEGLIVRL